jgi:hypothetical protein
LDDELLQSSIAHLEISNVLQYISTIDENRRATAQFQLDECMRGIPISSVHFIEIPALDHHTRD